MKLELCGFVHHDILKAYTDGNIPRYLVCGVDTYINPETAGDQDYDVENPFSMEREMFFSSRFFNGNPSFCPDLEFLTAFW